MSHPQRKMSRKNPRSNSNPNHLRLAPAPGNIDRSVARGGENAQAVETYLGEQMLMLVRLRTERQEILKDVRQLNAQVAANPRDHQIHQQLNRATGKWQEINRGIVQVRQMLLRVLESRQLPTPAGQ